MKGVTWARRRSKQGGTRRGRSERREEGNKGKYQGRENGTKRIAERRIGAIGERAEAGVNWAKVEMFLKGHLILRQLRELSCLKI